MCLQLPWGPNPTVQVHSATMSGDNNSISTFIWYTISFFILGRHSQLILENKSS